MVQPEEPDGQLQRHSVLLVMQERTVLQKFPKNDKLEIINKLSPTKSKNLVLFLHLRLLVLHLFLLLL